MIRMRVGGKNNSRSQNLQGHWLNPFGKLDLTDYELNDAHGRIVLDNRKEKAPIFCFNPLLIMIYFVNHYLLMNFIIQIGFGHNIFYIYNID